MKVKIWYEHLDSSLYIEGDTQQEENYRSAYANHHSIELLEVIKDYDNTEGSVGKWIIGDGLSTWISELARQTKSQKVREVLIKNYSKISAL